MTVDINQPIPNSYLSIKKATEKNGFTMASDILTCSLLRALAASKPAGKFLELGTGTGLSTSWILDGMDSNSTITSFDNDETCLKIARTFLGHDKRLNLICAEGDSWVENNKGNKFDYIFADTWHGKYLLLEEVLEMLSAGGLYIVDDMIPQPNWPEGHQEKANNFVTNLEHRKDVVVVKQSWATGIIIAVKR